MLVSLSNVTKDFSDKRILDNISFSINEKDKIALIGNNGSGKTTIFKLIIDEEMPTSGEIIKPKWLSIGHLHQNPFQNSNKTILDEFLSVKEEILEINQRLDELANLMAKADKELDNYINEYSHLSGEFERLDGWNFKNRAITILNGLNFPKSLHNQLVSSLSGGEKTRLELAKILFLEPDLMLLDEPTNHLDTKSIDFLEDYLNSYQKAVLVISHDRYFLDKVVKKTMLLHNCKISSYDGNYSSFHEKYKLEQLTYERAYENNQREIKRQTEIIKKFQSFNREKSIKAANSRIKALNKMEVLDKPENDIKMRFNLSADRLSGKDVLTISHLSKSFEKALFSNISFDIKRGERVALIGDNGVGKSTILKIINNELNPDNGEVKIGESVSLSYFDQEHNVLDFSKTVFDEISDSYPNLTNTEIRNALSLFLFTGDDVFKEISVLSGGERGRLSLAKLMLSRSNFLILDEPTNHLDIASKEVLEEALNDYDGTLLFVSHDRYFINQVATKILVLEANKITSYLGNYDYYLLKKNEINVEKNSSIETTVSKNKNDWEASKKEQARIKTLQKNSKELEELINSIEKKIEEIDESLSDDDIGRDLPKCSRLMQEKADLENSLEEAMIKWDNVVNELSEN